MLNKLFQRQNPANLSHFIETSKMLLNNFVFNFGNSRCRTLILHLLEIKTFELQQ